MNNKKLYKKITKHIRKRYGSFGLWDFPTMHIIYPDLCSKLIEIIMKEYPEFTEKQVRKFYVPYTI